MLKEIESSDYLEGKISQEKYRSMEIWKKAIEIALYSFPLSFQLKEEGFHFFAEQLRRISLGIYLTTGKCNDTFSREEMASSLALTRNGLFDATNLVILLNQRNLVSDSIRDMLLCEFDELNQRISQYMKNIID